MEPNDSSTRDCSTIYRFQFASIAFLCSVYLPFTFHSSIWSLYTQPFSPVNCSTDRNSFLSGSKVNNLTKPLVPLSIRSQNRSECCLCNDILKGNVNDKRLLILCQAWLANRNEVEERKSTIIEEWHLTCGEESRLDLLIGSTSFLMAEIIGVIIIGILADQYGRKLMLLMCLYIPVIFGSLAAFTTTYTLFLVLRWPVGFLNRGLLLLGFIMVIESCEYKHRAQIGCLLLAAIPSFGIIIGVTYFFLLDWRHMQLLGSLITTLTLCYPWLIPESRRWYVNSHRISRVNKLLQLCSSKQGPTLSLNNKVGSPAPTTMIYDKPIVSTKTFRIQATSAICLFVDQQLRTITACLLMLWLVSSFCYQCVFFPSIVSHPTINYILMNAIEFFSFIIALLVAYKIGRRVPLAVLILISGISSVSLAIALIGTGHHWLEITLSIVARVCLRTCYCLLILFTTELYPTSIRAIGLAVGLASEVIARITVEILLYFFIDRLLLLFISGGILCISSCLIFPLPETLLYDIPDSLSDLQSMKSSLGNDDDTKISPHTSRFPMIETTPRKLPRISESSTITSDLNDLLPFHGKTLMKSQQQADVDENSLTIRSQPEAIQLHSNTSTIKGLSNPCYFSLINDTIDQLDIEKQINNRCVISIRGVQNNTTTNNNNDEEREVTKF